MALLQVLGQGVVQSLQLETVLLGLLQGGRGDWGLGLFLRVVQGLLLVFLILILFIGVVLITLLVVLIHFLLALALDHGRVEVVLAHVHVVVGGLLVLLGLNIYFNLLRLIFLFYFFGIRLGLRHLALLPLPSFLRLLLELLVGLHHFLGLTRRSWYGLSLLSPMSRGVGLICALSLGVNLLLLFLSFLSLLTFGFLYLFDYDASLLNLFRLTVCHFIGGVLAYIVDVVIFPVSSVFLGIPAVFALTDESSVLVIHTIVASKG